MEEHLFVGNFTLVKLSGAPLQLTKKFWAVSYTEAKKLVREYLKVWNDKNATKGKLTFQHFNSNHVFQPVLYPRGTPSNH